MYNTNYSVSCMLYNAVFKNNIHILYPYLDMGGSHNGPRHFGCFCGIYTTWRLAIDPKEIWGFDGTVTLASLCRYLMIMGYQHLMIPDNVYRFDLPISWTCLLGIRKQTPSKPCSDESGLGMTKFLTPWKSQLADEQWNILESNSDDMFLFF